MFTSGVPQGSVLGPVLFLIFINDIPEAMTCTLILFADDTKLYTAANPAQVTNLQNNIIHACDWANTWQMIFNVKKCKHMHIGKKHIPNSYHMNTL